MRWWWRKEPEPDIVDALRQVPVVDPEAAHYRRQIDKLQRQTSDETIGLWWSDAT